MCEECVRMRALMAEDTRSIIVIVDIVEVEKEEEPILYTMGDRFRVFDKEESFSSEYILAQTGAKQFQLISVGDGNRFRDLRIYSSKRNGCSPAITDEQLVDHMGKQFDFIKINSGVNSRASFE